MIWLDGKSAYSSVGSFGIQLLIDLWNSGLSIMTKADIADQNSTEKCQCHLSTFLIFQRQAPFSTTKKKDFVMNKL